MHESIAPQGGLEHLSMAPAVELSRMLAAGEITSVDLTEMYLGRIARIDPLVHAFVTVLVDPARAAAAESDRRRAAGAPRGPLDGLPIAVKDLEPMAGVRYTRGVLQLGDDVAEVDALYVERLRAAGAVIVGKTNLPPFAYRGVTDNDLMGPTSTPWNLAFNSGGSSGGSAAAVAAGLVAVAEASDGGGSIRIPAALCGIVGYKPSAGLVADPAPNAFGLVNPYIHVGSVGRTVEDTKMFVDVIRGWDRFDPFSSPEPPRDLRPVVRVGVDRRFGDFPVEPRVLAVFDAAVAAIRASAEFEVVDIALAVPSHETMTSVWVRQVGVPHAVSMDAFAAQGTPLEQQMPADYREVIEQGRAASAIEYFRDGEVRSAVLVGIEAALDEVDVILTPTLAVDGIPNASAWGTTPSPSVVDGIAIDGSIGWCLTHPLNLSGHPAVSVPAGLSDRGLPVGMQVIGSRWGDDRVLAAAGVISGILAPLMN